MSKFFLGVAISIQSVVALMLYHFPTPFFLEKAKLKGIGVNLSGLILASAGFAPLILGFYTGALVSRCGHKKLLISAIVAESLLVAVFGLCEYITESDTFFAMSLGVRIALGAPIFIHKNIGFMLAAKYIPEKFEFIALFLSIGNNVGTGIALSQSIFIYQAFGETMLAPALVLMMLDLVMYLPLSLLCLPGSQRVSLDTLSETQEVMLSTVASQSDVSKELEIIEPFKLTHILKVPRVVFLLALACFQSYSDAYYASTIISEIVTYGLSEEIAPIFLALRPFCSVIATLLLPLIRVKFTRSRLLNCFLFTQVISLFLLGPSTAFGANAALQMMICGLLLKGFSAGITSPILLPEINYTLQSKYAPLYTSDQICNVTSGITGAASQFGTMLAYFTGAILCQNVSFRGASDIVNLLYFCIFLAILLSSSKPRNYLGYKPLDTITSKP